MALNFPSSPTNGQVYTDDNNISWQFDGVKWDVVKSVPYKIFSGVRAGLTSDFAVTSTVTSVSWDDIQYDVGDYYVSETPTRLIFRTTGFFRINFSALTSSSGSSYTVIVKKNGTVTLSSTVITINQYINYDEILELNAGDYIELCVSEPLSVGELLASSTYVEITRLGLSSGTAADTFSGARAKIDSSYATSAVATAISWDSAEFNQNSNAAGDTYWNVSSPTRLTVGTTSYYRIKIVILTNAYDTYTVSLVKNGATTLTSTTAGALTTVQMDEIYQLDVNDYVELEINDSSGTGGLNVGTYLEILRIGNV